MNTFDFTPEELDLNKRRQLSPRQRELLRTTARGVRKLSQTGVYVKIGFMVLGLCIILSMYLQNESSQAALFSNPSNLLWFPAIILIIAGILAFSLFFARRVSNRLLNAQLQVAEGRVRLDQQYNSGAAFTSYYVFVGRKKFSFTDDMSSTFKEGEKYRVYYCKATVHHRCKDWCHFF